MSYSEQLQSIVRRYRSAGEPWPATTKTIAAWAIANRLWQPQRSTLVTQCAEQWSGQGFLGHTVAGNSILSGRQSGIGGVVRSTHVRR